MLVSLSSQRRHGFCVSMYDTERLVSNISPRLMICTPPPCYLARWNTAADTCQGCLF